MTSDHDALLRAICENPREDTPRLAFADWLEEHGEPERAAFIRNDIAMSLRDEWDAERLHWVEADVSLPQLLTWAGLAPFPDLGPRGAAWSDARRWDRPIFRRGFPWSVQVSDLGLFRTRAAELFARHPITHLVFRATLPHLNRFILEPWFPRVAGLEWSAGRYSGRTLHPLLAARHANITDLAAEPHALNPDGLQAIFDSLIFPNLTKLRLWCDGQQLARVALESFARPQRLCQLRWLTIRGALNRDMLLLACSLPGSLRILDLTGSYVNSAAAREFAGARAVSGLRMLMVSSNQLGNDGGTALFTSPHLAGLKLLVAQYCQIGDDALRALLDNSPLADGLNLLDLTGSPASGDMKQAVKDRMGDRVRI